jgi:MYXO-CTERM domain-containing protein
MKSILKAAAISAALISSSAFALVVGVTDSTTFSVDGFSAPVTYAVAAAGTVTDVNITINFSKCDDPAPATAGAACLSLGEEYANEIYFQLTGANGTVINLLASGTYNRSVSSGGFYTLTFDDAASGAPSTTLASGTFLPFAALSILNGQAAAGNWVLTVGDTTGADPLTHFRSTLTITTDQDNPAPAPAAMALLGLGLAAIRRLRKV